MGRAGRSGWAWGMGGARFRRGCFRSSASLLPLIERVGFFVACFVFALASLLASFFLFTTGFATMYDLTTSRTGRFLENLGSEP
jgi:hypothetical protein